MNIVRVVQLLNFYSECWSKDILVMIDNILV